MREGFRTVECVREEYYDEFGRFHEIPHYITSECLCNSYEWGRLCVEVPDLEVSDYLSELDVYVHADDFPEILINRVAEVAGDDDIEYLEFEVVDNFAEDRGIKVMLDSGLTPTAHHFILSCRFEELIECVTNVSNWMRDLLELINEEGEKILAKYSPQDLELVTCSVCDAVIRRYLLDQHVREHEVKEANEELELLKAFLKMINGTPDLKDVEESFPKAVEKRRDEVLDLLRSKWLSSRHAEEVAQKVNDRLKGGGVIGLHNFGRLAEVYRLLLKEVPDYVLEEFIISKTVLPSILSEESMKELMKRLKTCTPVQESEGCGDDFNVYLTKREKKNALRIYVNVKCGDKVLASVRLGPTTIPKLRETLIRKTGSEDVVSRILAEVRRVLTSPP